MFREGGLNCVTGLGKYRGRLIVLLDMNKLLDHSSGDKGESGENHGPAKAEARSTAAR
jgi:chemotaxis signal transduction protein